MLLNSDSSNGQNSFSNIPSARRLSNRKRFGSFLGYSVKQSNNVSKFYCTSLIKSKKLNKKPNINIIINNNNPINYTGSLPSMYINSFSAEKNLKKNKNINKKMLLNSDTLKGKNSTKKKFLRRFSNRKSFQSFLNYSVKPTNNISKFSSMSLSKSKKMNLNPRINIIINNNNPINYTGSTSSIFINSFSGEKALKKNGNHEENSTFVFTGDNQSCIDNGQIIENYLRPQLENPIFECKSLSSISNKDQNEIIPSQEKSFVLSSSFSSNTTNMVSTLAKKKDNKNLIKMLKMINSESGKKKNENEQKIKDITSKAIKDNINNKKEEIESDKNTNKKNIVKRIGYFVFILIHVILYLNLIVYFFEPPANKLFYDNDHADYIYSISSLSQEKGIIINEDK